MGDFTINSLDYTQNPGPQGFVSNYDEFVDWHNYLEEDFVWWCLGHNFDVVGAILSMASLSWQKGWDARQTVYDFCAATDNEDAKRYVDPDDYQPVQ